MAKQPTKPEPNSTSSDGESSASETATGAVPATGGKLEEAGAGTDSPAPVFDAATRNAVQEELIGRIEARLLARAPLGERSEFLSRLSERLVPALCLDIVGGGADALADALLSRLLARELLVTEDGVARLLVATKPGEMPPPEPFVVNEVEDEAAKAELRRALGIQERDVFAVNVATRTIVTRDGQKHRLA